MKYFLYTVDMISTCFYSNSGYNSLIESDPSALDDWIEISEDLYEQSMTADENGNRALYAYDESGEKIASCTEIPREEAEKIMTEAQEKHEAELQQNPKEVIITGDKEEDSVDETATIIDASYTESSAAVSE